MRPVGVCRLCVVDVGGRVVWMRGPYRDLGLGRTGFQQVFTQMKQESKYNAMSLRTR